MSSLEERADKIRDMCGWNDGSDVEFGRILAELRAVRASALDEAATLCETTYADHYDHSQRKVAGRELAAAVRRLKERE